MGLSTRVLVYHAPPMSQNRCVTIKIKHTKVYAHTNSRSVKAKKNPESSITEAANVSFSFVF